MPPNRKTNADVVDGLATLSVQELVNPKFLPLTSQSDDAKKDQQQQEQLQLQVVTEKPAAKAIIHAEHASQPFHPAQSYWDWPPDEAASNAQLVRTICHEEDVRQTLSMTHVEEMLQASAAVTASETTVVVTSTAPKEEQDEDYWYTPSEEGIPSVLEESKTLNTSNDSYWSWTTPSKQEQKHQLIDQIKQEEECRVLTSGEHIQQRLVDVASSHSSPHDVDVDRTKPEHDSYWDWNPPATASHVADPHHPQHSYWDWHSDEKEQLTQQIVREEAIRQGLSIDHIEASLVQASTMTKSSAPTVTAATSTGSYWDW